MRGDLLVVCDRWWFRILVCTPGLLYGPEYSVVRRSIGPRRPDGGIVPA